ncbi:guanine nucleotide exchange factor [Endogone sp. FLAS-F59071]|nr:guanine nucleotide exchange factor [Endogone sp. FLAS-F59071]|eukprot:RUS19657.1 guanine nucleotide exchange factor [Endogone sp. FLAS-F59071]
MSAYTAIRDKADLEATTVALNQILSDSRLAIASKNSVVRALVTDLGDPSLQVKWNDPVRSLALLTLKMLGREVDGSDALFSEEGIRVLMTHAGMIPTPTSAKDDLASQEALKCIANCIFLASNIKDIFQNHDGVSSSVLYLKDSNLSVDSRFLLSRILFLMTVDRLDVVRLLIDDLEVAGVIASIVSQNVQSLIDDPVQRVDVVTREMVISEALKLLFNLMTNDPKCVRAEKGKSQEEQEREEEKIEITARRFESCLPPIIHLLTSLPYPTPLPLAPPHSHAVHALLNFPIASYRSVWFPSADDYSLVRGMVDALDDTLRLTLADDPDDLDGRPARPAQGASVDDTLPPLAIVLGKVARADKGVREWMRKRMLPDNVDRTMALNRGDTFSARMIRTMTSALLPNVCASISELLYAVCNEDANLLIYHVGYGSAAGFLVNRGIAIDPSTASASDSGSGGRSFDPITGRYTGNTGNTGPALADMTDEEKEREAERLFVLFERLNKTGVVTAENPIAKAMREGYGRVEEVEDKEDDD